MSARKKSCEVCKHTPEDQSTLKDLGNGEAGSDLASYVVCKDQAACIGRLMTAAVPAKEKPPVRKPRAKTTPRKPATAEGAT